MIRRMPLTRAASLHYLNLYEVVTDLDMPSAAIERHLCHTVAELKRVLKIPIAVKVSPFFAAFGNVARRLDAAGADGLDGGSVRGDYGGPMPGVVRPMLRWETRCDAPLVNEPRG